MMPDACPRCREPLEGLGTFCWTCQEYTDTPEADAPQKITAPTDNRSEDERKHDARPAVQALGWEIIDTEQGWRPFECPGCGKPIPGGTRVRKGFPDWLVMGHGLIAFLEWKSATGTQSDAQKEFQDLCSVHGVPYRVVRTTEEAAGFLSDLIAPTIGATP